MLTSIAKFIDYVTVFTFFNDANSLLGFHISTSPTSSLQHFQAIQFF